MRTNRNIHSKTKVCYLYNSFTHSFWCVETGMPIDGHWLRKTYANSLIRLFSSVAALLLYPSKKNELFLYAKACATTFFFILIEIICSLKCLFLMSIIFFKAKIDTHHSINKTLQYNSWFCHHCCKKLLETVFHFLDSYYLPPFPNTNKKRCFLNLYFFSKVHYSKQ